MAHFHGVEEIVMVAEWSARGGAAGGDSEMKLLRALKLSSQMCCEVVHSFEASNQLSGHLLVNGKII